jgi:hypothetical protein
VIPKGQVEVYSLGVAVLSIPGRRIAGPLADAAGYATGRALSLLPLVPGLGGAGAVTFGAAVLVHSAWHWIPVYAVATVVGGAFALLLDRRL